MMYVRVVYLCIEIQIRQGFNFYKPTQTDVNGVPAKVSNSIFLYTDFT